MRNARVCTLLVVLTTVCGTWAWADTDAYAFTDLITGYQIEAFAIASSPTPPLGFEAPIVGLDELSLTAKMLTGVPTSSWTYGCSATSAGMMFGYYDRDPRDWYPNMWAAGVAPDYLGNSHPIIATSSHVTDYWISSGQPGPDPWEGNWTEHTWADCTADYMGTNQWKWDLAVPSGKRDANIDGSTMLWSYDSADKLYDYIPSAAYGLPQTALCHGLRLFAESRGYTVLENYTQKIDTLKPGGFSFADYMWEIDHGYPVMVQIVGHSMVGVGYDTTGNTVYLHDTWGNYLASMTWGGSYSGMTQQAMTVIHLEAIPEPATIALFALGLLGLGARLRKRKAS